MFGWLKKRFGRIRIGRQRFSYSALAGMDATRLEQLGIQGATRGEAVACLWVMEALVDKGHGTAQSAIRVAETAQATLTPEHLVELQITLTGCVTPQCPGSIREAIIRSQLDLVRELISAGAHQYAQRMLEQAVPAVAVMDHVPEGISLLLVEGAQIAREQRWNRAILALLDRKLRFSSTDDKRAASLLMGMALGAGDRALEHLQVARMQSDNDVECHYLLGAAHASRAKKARSDSEFADERQKSLHHLDRARQLAVDSGSGFSGVTLGAASGVALLALMAPTYDEIMYLEGPLKGAQASGGHSSMSE